MSAHLQLYHVVVVRRRPAGHIDAGLRYDDVETRITREPTLMGSALVIAKKHRPYQPARGPYWTSAELRMFVRTPRPL